jgi:hypothetical protein
VSPGLVVQSLKGQSQGDGRGGWQDAQWGSKGRGGGLGGYVHNSQDTLQNVGQSLESHDAWHWPLLCDHATAQKCCVCIQTAAVSSCVVQAVTACCQAAASPPAAAATAAAAAAAAAAGAGAPPGPHQPPFVAVVVGPKNAGKSSFARLLVNSLLHDHPCVYYLDTDCGQPEYTAPVRDNTALAEPAVGRSCITAACLLPHVVLDSGSGLMQPTVLCPGCSAAAAAAW